MTWIRTACDGLSEIENCHDLLDLMLWLHVNLVNIEISSLVPAAIWNF
jgi:hypothetical protein